MRTISTTIPDELWNLAKEKQIQWNIALIRGIKVMANEENPKFEGETIDKETLLAKKIQQNAALQRVLDDTNDELEELKNVLAKKERSTEA